MSDDLEHETSRLLDAVDRLLARFVAFPSEHDRHAVAAWVLHTWTLDAFESTPRLALLSPEKGSGKTRTLEVLELVVPNAKHTVNMSAAALFRIVGAGEDADGPGRATLLMDEADTYLGWKVAREHEDVRGLVNAGHRRGAVAYRVSVEKGVTVQEFPAFAAVALAGIGDLPDTIIDRSVVVAMKRRAPSEQVEPFRRRHVEPSTVTLTEALESWGVGAVPALEAHLEGIELPAGIEDRPADVWEALVAIGDLAGEPWSDRLRTAAVTLNGQRAERDPSLGIQLLRDVRDIFDRLEVDRLASVEVASELASIEGAPWADLRGAPIDANGIARRLKPYGVRPQVHRFGDGTARGYLRSDFLDAWTRYLPPPHPEGRNGRNPRNEPVPDERPTHDNGPAVTAVTPVTPPQGGEGSAIPLAVCRGCDGPAERQSVAGTWWCGTCWDREAGAAS